MTPDAILNCLLYKDSLMLVLNKPAGLPVHAGPKGGDNLEMFLDPLRFGLPRLPSLAHRLDRDTSGCLILGRHSKALRKLGKLFQQGRVEKTYWAVVDGAPPKEQGVLHAKLRKLTPKSGWKMVVDEAEGQPAVTEYRVLGRSDDGRRTWLECKPKTGRTHQIRVHCAHLGCPIVGDAVYGTPGVAPLHLHARGVAVPLYPSRDEPIAVEAPVPEHMRALLKACGFSEAADVAAAP
ncbi:Ribosomal large subunit pseudouridine synthase C [Caenispirillum salinarum AK4]|uniref:Ribosomal large subunit pseudouridine synthase C n=1 Tax=Caenispirillum salinarum AK4 TaxID=1238182 RepID=K9HF45_9PROT|nr:RNA pseudouridine synthase [Caenispirillum salinarum]EKV27301.1 Ribosomal large subunit pseudouridine synthase C [Caenispirillum salinarum AK4]